MAKQIKGVEQIKGDLIDCDADVIVQQCNCITRKHQGLTTAIATRLGVDPYKTRTPHKSRTGPSPTIADLESSDAPGTVSIYQVPGKAQSVACLFAQYAPGSARKTYPFYERIKKERGVVETYATRKQWFSECLEILTEKLGAESRLAIAFPYGIGCGLAGGSWSEYYEMIRAWSERNPQFSVLIVKLE